MSLNKDGSSQDFQTTGVSVLGPVITNPFVSFGRTILFDANDFNSSGFLSSPEQYAKLQNMFNMYQEFKLSGVRVEFHPRHNVSQSQGPFWNGSGVVYPDYPAAVTGVVSSAFTDTWYIYFKVDKNDAVLRSTNLDEFIQTTIQPGVIKTSSDSRCSFYVRPHIMDAVMQQSGILQVAQASGVGTNLVGGSMAEIGTGGTQFLPDDVPARWLPTKVPSTGPTTNTNLNLQLEHYGLKIYVFNPMLALDGISTTGFQVPLGWMQFTYYWSFRTLETRAQVSLITMNDGLPHEAKIRNLFTMEPKLTVMEKSALNSHRLDYPSHPLVILADELPSKEEKSTNSSEKRRKLGVS